MSFFDRQTATVEIDDENRVVIRKLTYGERQRCLSVAARGKLDQGGESVDLDPGRLALERLSVAIVSWEGPGFDGRPVSRENIEALPPEVLDPVTLALAEMGTGLDEKKP
jgi:hypothetical protein